MVKKAIKNKPAKKEDTGAYYLLDFARLMPWIAVSVFLLFLVLVFLVYRSFLLPLFIAAILYILFRRPFFLMHTRFNLSRNLSAYLSLLSVIIVIFIPLYLIASNLTSEVKYVLDFLQKQFTAENLTKIFKDNEWISQFTPFTLEEFTALPSKLRPLIEKQGPKIFSPELITQGRLILGDTFRILFNLLLAFILLFFLFRNGDKIKEAVFRNLPLPDDIKQQMGSRMVAVFDAVVKGNLLIAVAQGIFIGFYFWIFGLSTPILYGIIGVFLGLIPIIGTNVLWIPGALYLYFAGFPVKAIVFGGLATSTYLILENIAKPLMLDKELNMHPMVLFFAVLGGLTEFGIKGLIIGPFAVTIFLSIWQMIKVWNLQNESKA